MRLLLGLLVVVTLVSAQEAPEGYVSKESIEKLFNATQGGGEIFFGELSPLFAEKGIMAPEGFEPLGSTQQDYSEGMIGAAQQISARAFFDASNEMTLEPFRKNLEENGWTNLDTALATVWGFVGAEQTTTFNTYGSFCKGNTLFGYNIYDDILSLNLDSYEETTNICQEQITQNQAYFASEDTGINVPDLQLTPPTTSIALVSENLPYYPVPNSTIENIDLPGGWSSRTTLSTKLAPSRVLGLYNMQMARAGWSMGRTNADELNTWSEWTLTDEAGQKWLATLNVTHHESLENLLMPVLVVLTVE